MTTRKKYSKEFKLEAISLVLEQGYTQAETARSLDINANMLGRWIREYQDDEGQAFRGNGKLTSGAGGDSPVAGGNIYQVTDIIKIEGNRGIAITIANCENTH
jgi:transposase